LVGAEPGRPPASAGRARGERRQPAAPGRRPPRARDPGPVRRALTAWYNDRAAWAALVRRIMEQDWSWCGPSPWRPPGARGRLLCWWRARARSRRPRPPARSARALLGDVGGTRRRSGIRCWANATPHHLSDFLERPARAESPLSLQSEAWRFLAARAFCHKLVLWVLARPCATLWPSPGTLVKVVRSSERLNAPCRLRPQVGACCRLHRALPQGAEEVATAIVEGCGGGPGV